MKCRDDYKIGARAANYKHGGMTNHKLEYNSWRAMRERCNNPNYWCFNRYGGRGIKVCEQWDGKNGFKHFLKDMGTKPTSKHTINRINNNGDYTPQNCEWSGVYKQKNNTSRNRLETIDGVTKTVSQWCRQYGKKNNTIYNRLRDGWSFEKAIKTPLNPAGKPFTTRAYHKQPRSNCISCGKKCTMPKQIYCTRDCYLFMRWGYVDK